MIGVHIVDGVTAIILALLALQQVRIRNASKREHQQLLDHVDVVHRVLIDTSGPTADPSNEAVRPPGAGTNVRSVDDPPSTT